MKTQGVAGIQSVVVLFVLLFNRHRAIGQYVCGICRGVLRRSTSRVTVERMAALLRGSRDMLVASTSAIIRGHDVSVKLLQVPSGTWATILARRLHIVGTDIGYCNVVVLTHELVHGHLAVDRLSVRVIRA